MFRRICAIVLFALAATYTPAHAADFSKRFVTASPPKDMPAFTFVDGNGHTLNLKDFAGHYVLLNLWATWCAPCVRELPSLAALQRLPAARNLTVVALTEDVSGRTAARGFYDRHGIKDLPVYADTAGMAPTLLHAPGLPVTFLIDPQGRQIGHIAGEADWTAPGTVAFLKTLMQR